jgi:hypothetical protein
MDARGVLAAVVNLFFVHFMLQEGRELRLQGVSYLKVQHTVRLAYCAITLCYYTMHHTPYTVHHAPHTIHY